MTSINFSPRAEYKRSAEVSFKNFIISEENLLFPNNAEPLLSIIIVAHNQPELLWLCLRSFYQETAVPFELILVDNSSGLENFKLYSKVSGITFLENKENLHFIRAANQGARRARGKFLLFLNSDCELFPGCLAAAVARITSSTQIGVVGGKILNIDDSLQESGFFVSMHKICRPIGFGESPDLPIYNKVRQIVACSGAFLMTPSAIFQQLGGFNELYFPAYCEDIHFCLEVQSRGFDVIYEPEARVRHLGFGSGNVATTRLLISRNQKKLQKYWQGRIDDYLKITSRVDFPR